MKDKDPAKVIKTALGEALVHYYPLAGRVKEMPDGRLVVDCTAEGVGFVEADADITLDEFGEDSFRPPFPCVHELVHSTPEIVGGPIFTLQITRLLCGGFILSFSCNHLISDGKGALQFVSRIAEISRGVMEPSLVPVWQRELLNVRNPPRVTCDKVIKAFQENHDEKVIKDQLQEIHDKKELQYCSIFFGPQEVEALRSRIPLKHLRESCSTFDLIIASVFRSRTIALKHRPEEIVCLMFLMEIRGKLSLPNSFYGNAYVPAVLSLPAGKVCENDSFSYLVEQVKKAKEEVTKEYVRSLIDLRAMGRTTPPPKALFLVSDLSRHGLSSLDFGWGKPVFAGTTDNGLQSHLVSFIVAFRNGRLHTLCLPAHAISPFYTALNILIHGVESTPMD